MKGSLFLQRGLVACHIRESTLERLGERSMTLSFSKIVDVWASIVGDERDWLRECSCLAEAYSSEG